MDFLDIFRRHKGLCYSITEKKYERTRLSGATTVAKMGFNFEFLVMFAGSSIRT